MVVSKQRTLDFSRSHATVYSAYRLLATAKAMVMNIAERRAPRLSSLHRSDKLEDFGAASQIIEFARAQASKQATLPPPPPPSFVCPQLPYSYNSTRLELARFDVLFSQRSLCLSVRYPFHFLKPLRFSVMSPWVPL